MKPRIVCKVHGIKHAVLEELRPGSPFHSVVRCRGRKRGKPCRHTRDLSEEQVKRYVKRYPNSEMHEYEPSSYDVLFGEPRG